MNNYAKTVLVVEDDPYLLLLNKKKLTRGGYNVLCANSIEQARAELGNRAVDLIVLDVMLPDGSGFDFCKEVKQNINNNIIILFLTGKTQTSEKINGLNIGGDYYLTKPYDLNELLAIVSSLLRRLSSTNCLEFGRLSLYIEKMVATVDGKDLLLTPKEYSLLYVLAKNYNTYITAEELFAKCWPNSEIPYSASLLWAQLSRLRKKLEKEGVHYITNERNKGYILEIKY